MIALVAALVVCDPQAPVVDVSCGDGPLFEPVVARAEHYAPGEPQEPSKREVWFRDKVIRADIHVSEAELKRAQKLEDKPDARSRARNKRKEASRRKAAGADEMANVIPGMRVRPVTTLFNIWTREAMPILPGEPVKDRIHLFLRDHFTNQATHMDTRLVDVLTRAARKFSAQRIEVVSGYRSPKYNLMLRKKGHSVARQSQHVEGHAVDFRIRGVPTKTLHRFVRSLRLGGVGFYPQSQFVHTDTGKIRYWTGS